MSALAVAAGHRAVAQDAGWPRWWFGFYGGANVNVFNGTLHTPNAAVTVRAPDGFTRGTGVGLSAGAILENNSGGLLGGNLMVGYDNRSFDVDPADGEELSASLAYITIEPNARIHLGDPRLHVTIGPAVAINVASSFEYVGPDSAGVTTTTNGEFSDVRGLVIAGQAGIGYDIPLSGRGSLTQVVLTPFAQARLGQGLIDPPPGDNDELGVTSFRFGLQMKFGTRERIIEPGPKPVRGDFEIAIKVPDVINDTRTLRETFPMRNYVFFDAGSTDLPERYARLAPADAGSFREEQLVRGGEPGATTETEVRSRQQMRAYYNVLNVIGDRMRRNTAAIVRLVGAAGGDAEAGRVMAENVKRYLVDTFAIDARRIAAEGSPMPPNRSGSGASQGEDAKMIEAENYRVTILGSEELLRPLNILTVQEEPIDDDIVVSIPPSDDVAYWYVQIENAAGQTFRFGPFRSTTTARIQSKPLLGAEREGTYSAQGILTLDDGSTLTSPPKSFHLLRAGSIEEKSGTRFSILFEFDESKTVQTYDRFLTETVAASIPSGATVIVHGHTDLIGTPEYNLALAQRRVEETQRILTRELTRAGKTVTFDTYGFGEDERRAPFDNVLPEQRFYNRTVVIEVVK